MGEDRKSLWCPLWKELCEEGVTESIIRKTKKNKLPSKCRYWIGVAGKNPQTGKETNEHDCAMAWLPTLQLEVARVDFSLGGAVESLRNRVNEMGQGLGQLARALPLLTSGGGTIEVAQDKKVEIEHKPEEEKKEE